ncbi:MAG: hypothetical protein WAV20_05145 [Blastocatellia bacterium]
MSDPVREYLRNKGCAQHVIDRGLQGLVRDWEKTVESIEQGYKLGLDDYLNDMDGRQLIEETLAIDRGANASRHRERVRRADEHLRKLVTPVARSLWGDEAAVEHGWSAERNWWYFSEPKTAGPELLEDLKRRK